MGSVQAEPAPDFSFIDPFTDESTSLGGLQGQVVYLDFWASWCIPCRQSFPFMNELHERYGDRGLTILAVNVDEQEADAERFLQQFPASFRILYDHDATLPPIYNVMGMPTAYLIDHNGQIEETKIGFRIDQRGEIEQRLREMLRSAGHL
ncbi:MAG: TlpA family protein disulfide reductase [Natronospirillum sp.]|uniref:TlpA family protein disulfide reductase n=1 Tax=Natronospirillum sp. TaxID=2812955 RepID=UPI0025ED213F|nr:TlpA disulfide reductase family protein [Natronospirillum sp.]MCH8552007.1 TlpA family protein disulfide reductase [Natronospirillum sp.]